MLKEIVIFDKKTKQLLKKTKMNKSVVKKYNDKLLQMDYNIITLNGISGGIIIKEGEKNA